MMTCEICGRVISDEEYDWNDGFCEECFIESEHEYEDEEEDDCDYDFDDVDYEGDEQEARMEFDDEADSTQS